MERNSISEGSIVEPRPGCQLRRLVDGSQMNQIHVRMEPGAAHGMHSHQNEQIGYVLSGELTVREEEGETLVLGAGESYRVAAGVRHGVENTGDDVVESVETFGPPRDFDYWES